MHQRIKFKGEQYWLNDGLISPLDHFSEDGELLADPLNDISYAIVEGNKIKRFHGVIGTVDEIEYLDAENTPEA